MFVDLLQIAGPADVLWCCVVVACLLSYRWFKSLRPSRTELHAGSSAVLSDTNDGSITLSELLEMRVPSLFKPFKPAWWLPGYALLKPRFLSRG